MQASFADYSKPVEDTVQALGGKVLDKIWLNGSIAARLPATAIAKLQDIKQISLLDVPHRITRE